MRHKNLIIFFIALIVSNWILPVLSQDSPLPPQPPDILYLTPEQESETLKYIQEINPDKFDEVSTCKQIRPERYKRIMSRAFREMRFLKELKVKNPKRYERVLNEKKLDQESRELARQYRNTEDEAEKNQIKKELEALLYELFNLRQINRKDEIDKLEKKLSELKKINQKRLANKNEIVRMRLQRMLGEEKGMEW